MSILIPLMLHSSMKFKPAPTMMSAQQMWDALEDIAVNILCGNNKDVLHQYFMTRVIMLQIQNIFYILGCVTNGGASAGKLCIFPFVYNGITYTTCALENDGYWCSTKVDSNGVHIGNQGNWGTCASDCNPGSPRNQGSKSKA